MTRKDDNCVNHCHRHWTWGAGGQVPPPKAQSKAKSAKAQNVRPVTISSYSRNSKKIIITIFFLIFQINK